MQLLAGTAWPSYQRYSAESYDWVRMLASSGQLFLLLVKQVFQVYVVVFSSLPWLLSLSQKMCTSRALLFSSQLSSGKKLLTAELSGYNFISWVSKQWFKLVPFRRFVARAPRSWTGRNDMTWYRYAFSENQKQMWMLPRTGNFSYFVCTLVLSVLISLPSLWLSLFSFSHEHNDGAFRLRYFRQYVLRNLLLNSWDMGAYLSMTRISLLLI